VNPFRLNACVYDLSIKLLIKSVEYDELTFLLEELLLAIEELSVEVAAIFALIVNRNFENV